MRLHQIDVSLGSGWNIMHSRLVSSNDLIFIEASSVSFHGVH